MTNATQLYNTPTLPSTWQNIRYHMNPLNRHGDLLKATCKVASWAFVFKGAEQLVRDSRTYSWSYISEAFSRSSKGALTDGLKHVAAKYIDPSTRYALSCSFVAACFVGVYIIISSALPSWKAAKELNRLNSAIADQEDLVRQFVREKRLLPTPESDKTSSTPPPASQEKLSWQNLNDKLRQVGDNSLDLKVFSSLLAELYRLYTERLKLCVQGNQKISFGDFLNSDPTPILDAE